MQDYSSTFSGGVDVQAGTLFLGSNSTLESGVVVHGPAGTGTLILGNNTTLRANTYSDLTLDNAMQIGTGVTLGNQNEANGYRFNGTVTPLNTATTVIVASQDAVFFNGPITNVAGGAASAFTFTTAAGNQGPGTVVLTGTNTYSGGTVADGTGVVFYSAGSLPATGNIAATNQGYVSTGYSGGMTSIIGHIGSPGTFNGALGFDTDPDQSSTPTVFSDTINLSAFSTNSTVFYGLGTQTSAILTGHITPPSGGDYVFGGGNGVLQVQSTLGAVADVLVHSNGSAPLTVFFQGNNAYSGNLVVDHSVVVLDGMNALPGESVVHLSADSYVGYTELTGLSPSDLLSTISSYEKSSVLGFDTTAANLPAGRSIAATVNLSGFSDIFIGSATHAHLAGTIIAPSSGQLSLTGVRGGWLTIDSDLLTTHVGSLLVGGTATKFSDRGYVELTGAGSDFAGGTTLRSGYLLLGTDSTVEGADLIAGPLGTGALTFSGYSNSVAPALAATSDGLTLHNDIHFAADTEAQIGVYRTYDSADPAYPVQAYQNNGLILAGNLSGTPDGVTFVGNGTFTLSGDNSALHTSEFDIGGAFSSGRPLVVADSNTALGATDSMICLAGGADLQFTTLAPVIGSIMGGNIASFDTSDRSYVELAANSVLTINQAQDGAFYGSIGGAPINRNSNNGFASVNASLVKYGGGTLTLVGQSKYSGGTTINAGTIVAGSSTLIDTELQTILSGPLGTGPITLNGGRLSFAQFGLGSVSLANPILFGASGGTLAGNVTFKTAITAGTNVVLAPGNSPGLMTFSSGLTFASGGTYNVDIYDMGGTPSNGFDSITVNGGTFAITATAATPFTLRLTSLATLEQAGLLGTTPTGPASMIILQASSGISGYDGANLVIDASNFSSSLNGLFSLSVGGESNSQLRLNFTPVPEPSTYALLALGLGLMAVTVRRRR